MNKKFKSLSLVLAGVVASLSLTTAFSTYSNVGAADKNQVLVSGSTALLPLAQQAAVLFGRKNPAISVQVQGGGSGTGLNNVVSGASDIGMSDVFAEEKLDADKAKKLVDHKVCVVGFAAVANKKVTAKNLTQQQLIDIFTAKVTNWKEVGGSDMPIVIINRPKSSGTRATFKKYALNNNEEASGQALTEDSSGAVETAIAKTPGAIGYLALPYALTSSKITVLHYNGVAPTNANIETGKYPIWSYEHMYTNGNPTGSIKKFLDYMNSAEVKVKVVTRQRYIPLADMKVKR